MLVDIENVVTLENSGEIMELALGGKGLESSRDCSDWHSGPGQIISPL